MQKSVPTQIIVDGIGEKDEVFALDLEKNSAHEGVHKIRRYIQLC